MRTSKRKFSVVDIAIIVVIILLIAGAFYKFRGLDKTNKNAETVPITYTVEVKQIRDFIFQNVKEGDTLYDKTSGNPIGTITKIESTPSRQAMAKTNGDVEMMEIENRIDVIFTVEADATKTDDVYYINRTYKVIRNSSRTFMTKYFECSGTIKSVSER